MYNEKKTLEKTNINTFIPTGVLKPFIKKYLIIESQDELVNRVLPDASLVMAFRYKGEVSYLLDDRKKRLPSSIISGLRKSKRFINYSKNAGNILVIFKETGVNAFVEEPIFELFGDSVSLDKLNDFQDLSIIEEQLYEVKNNAQRINIIEQFLISKLSIYKPDMLIITALKKIRLAKGRIKIKDLADSLYIT